MIVLSINRNILISNGLWDKREEQIENIFTANERVETNKDREFKNQRDTMNLIRDFLFLKPGKKPSKEEKEKEENKNININIKKISLHGHH